MSSRAAPTRSKARLITKSIALEHRRLELEQRQRLAGDELDPVHQDLHRRRRHPHPHAVAVAAVDQLHGSLLRELGVGDQHLVDRVEVALEALERAEVAQALGRPPPSETKPNGSISELSRQRVRDSVDVGCGAHQHRAAAVAGRAQQHAAHPLEHPAQERHVEQREEQRAVEDVVGRELGALDHRVEQDHHGHLDERRDHRGEAGPLRAVAVEARAREQQQHHQARQRRHVLRLVERPVERARVLDRHLDRQRRPDGEEHGGHVEAHEHRHARGPTQRLELQQSAQQRRRAGPHVAAREHHRLRRLDLLKLSCQPVAHAVSCCPSTARGPECSATGRTHAGRADPPCRGLGGRTSASAASPSRGGADKRAQFADFRWRGRPSRSNIVMTERQRVESR